MYESVNFCFGGKFTSRGTWQHPERIQDTTELILMTGGTAHIEIEGKKYSASEGDALLIDNGKLHRGFMESSEVSFIWLHFKCDKDLPLPEALSKPKDQARIQLIARQLLHYANTEGYPEEAASCLMRLLLIELSRTDNQSTSSAKLCAAICQYVELNCHRPLKPSDLSLYFNYNKDYLGRIFKAEKKCSLKEYIDSVRLKKIKKELTKDTLSLQDISDQFAFSDYKYFLKFFKYHEGISPSEYRRSYYNTIVNDS